MKVAKTDKGLQFNTPHFTTFKVEEAKITKISVSPKKLVVIPGSGLRLKVMATTLDKLEFDVTEQEAGTTYKTSDPEIATVEENGLIKVSPNAKDGSKFTITAKNNGKATKANFTVKTVSKISVVPKKVTLAPGERVPMIFHH